MCKTLRRPARPHASPPRRQIPEGVLRGFLSRYLSERLVGMLADPVEKCREMAGGKQG